MNNHITLIALAMASIAIAGCDQSRDIDNDLETEQPEYSDDTMGTDKDEVLDDVDPVMGPAMEPDMQDPDLPDQQPDPMRDPPQ